MEPLGVLYSIIAALSSSAIQQIGAQKFEASGIFESVLNEVFMPCVENVSNITFTTAPTEAENVTQNDASSGNNTYVNEFGFCVPYEPGQGLCDNFLSAEDFIFVPFERQSLRVIQEAVDGAFNLFTLLPDTECFRAALAMFCYHYFIPCTSSPSQAGLPRPLCLDECITVSVDRCSDEWNTGLTFVASEPQLQTFGLGLPDCCNLTRQIGPVHNCCQPLGEFQRDTLLPSYQICFPELITVAPTNSSEATLNVQETLNITVIVIGTVSGVAVLFLLIVTVVISLVFSISLWRRAQIKKKWDAHERAGNSRVNASNSMQFNASYISSGSHGRPWPEGQGLVVALRRVKTVYRRQFESSNLVIPITRLKVMEIVGQGEFGSVKRGILMTDTNCTETPVAIKTLKDVLSQDDVDKFLEESLHMKNFNHLNVLHLHGICMDNPESPMLVMPYMEHGSLLSYLRRKREYISIITTNEYVNTITECSLLSMCLQIARGMEYLAGLRFVHRDLAARNCMIDGDYNVKVADFGLTKDVYDRNYYQAMKNEKVPARWMPLESLVNGVWSEKSDIWSFGVTCWEVFTFGHIPYPGVDIFSIVQFLEKGKRLQKPGACNDDMYKVIYQCWAAKPDKRPTFKDLVDEIGGLLSSRAGYLDLNIDKALTAAEELSVTEYSYSDPDRMFCLIQSLRTPGIKHSNDANQLHSHETKTPQSGVKSYVYTGLLTSPQDPVSKSTYTSLQHQIRPMASKPATNSPPLVNHKTAADTTYTKLIASTLTSTGQADCGYTSMAMVDHPHYVNVGAKPTMRHKLGSNKAELITSSPYSDPEDKTELSLVDSGSSYVNGIYNVA